MQFLLKSIFTYVFSHLLKNNSEKHYKDIAEAFPHLSNIKL